MRQLILPFCHRCVDVGQMTGCSWRQHGVGGTLDTTQFLCLLATNIANEKVFIFLWFWYIALFLITLVNIGYYCILLFSKDVKWRDRFIDISVRSTRSRTLQYTNCQDRLLFSQIASLDGGGGGQRCNSKVFRAQPSVNIQDL